MPIKHAIWLVGDQPTPLVIRRVANEHVLQAMIVRDPRILSSRWMLIGQHEFTPFAGRIDLLAIVPDAVLIVSNAPHATRGRQTC
jgi:hypothetical protein